MRDRPPIKYPLGDWVNNRNNSLEEQVTETQKAIDTYEFMIANNHRDARFMKQELVLRYSRLNALKDVLENPRLGKEQSNICRKIVQELVETRQRGTLWKNPSVSWKQLEGECKKVAHRFPNMRTHVQNVIRLWEYNWG